MFRLMGIDRYQAKVQSFRIESIVRQVSFQYNQFINYVFLKYTSNANFFFFHMITAYPPLNISLCSICECGWLKSHLNL